MHYIDQLFFTFLLTYTATYNGHFPSPPGLVGGPQISTGKHLELALSWNKLTVAQLVVSSVAVKDLRFKDKDKDLWSKDNELGTRKRPKTWTRTWSLMTRTRTCKLVLEDRWGQGLSWVTVENGLLADISKQYPISMSISHAQWRVYRFTLIIIRRMQSPRQFFEDFVVRGQGQGQRLEVQGQGQGLKTDSNYNWLTDWADDYTDTFTWWSFQSRKPWFTWCTW